MQKPILKSNFLAIVKLGKKVDFVFGEARSAALASARGGRGAAAPRPRRGRRRGRGRGRGRGRSRGAAAAAAAPLADAATPPRLAEKKNRLFCSPDQK